MNEEHGKEEQEVQERAGCGGRKREGGERGVERITDRGVEGERVKEAGVGGAEGAGVAERGR